MKYYCQSKFSGIAMVELVVALSVSVIGILGILTLLSRAVGLTKTISDQFTANYLAAEGIEIVKNIIDDTALQGDVWNSNINSGSFEVDYTDRSLRTDLTRPLRFDSVTGLYSYQSGVPSVFSRTILIDFITVDEVKVNSIVNWTGRNDSAFQINVEDHFLNWRP